MEPTNPLQHTSNFRTQSVEFMGKLGYSKRPGYLIVAPAELIDSEVRQILNEEYSKALGIIR